MAVTAAALRELHQIHQKLAELRDRVEQGPKRIRIYDANVTKLKLDLQETQDRVQQTQLAIDSKQLDLKTGEQKIFDLKVKLNTANTNKEYQMLMEQIAASEMAGSVLADEILESLEKIDTLAVAVQEAEKVVAVGIEELQKTRRAVEESADSLRTGIVRLEEDLSRAEAALADEIKEDYQRVVRSKGAQGLAAYEDGVCSGCGQNITLNMQNELMLSRPVFCRTCGCLLYMADMADMAE